MCRSRSRKFMTDKLDVYYWSQLGCLLRGEILTSLHKEWRRKLTTQILPSGTKHLALDGDVTLPRPWPMSPSREQMYPLFCRTVLLCLCLALDLWFSCFPREFYSFSLLFLEIQFSLQGPAHLLIYSGINWSNFQLVSQNLIPSGFRNLQKLHLCLFSLIPVLSDHERVISGQELALKSNFLMIFDWGPVLYSVCVWVYMCFL